MTQSAARPLLVFADDWGRHPSSCQHLIRHLLPRREVIWVNTIGTRPPRLDWSTAKRVAGKLSEWARGWRTLPSVPEVCDPGSNTSLTEASNRQLSPRVVAPKMWPSFKTRFARRLNRSLLIRSLRPVVESLSQSPVVITTLPLVADLVGALPVHQWVYYCVDDFSVWPGYDGETMLRMERELVPRMDTIIAVSETLVRHIADLGRPAHLLTHGVDLDHWRVSTPEPVPEFMKLTSPRIVFWGVVDRRMDTVFVKHLAANLAEGTIVLIGPQEDPDPELLRLPRIVTLPPMAYDRLPTVAANSDVLIMPYIDAPVTRAMQPLKLKEYLATGQPVVVRRLPATELWAASVDLAETPEQFTARVRERLQSGVSEEQLRDRQRLDVEGWPAKAELFENWVKPAETALP